MTLSSPSVFRSEAINEPASSASLFVPPPSSEACCSSDRLTHYETSKSASTSLSHSQLPQTQETTLDWSRNTSGECAKRAILRTTLTQEQRDGYTLLPFIHKFQEMHLPLAAISGKTCASTLINLVDFILTVGVSSLKGWGYLLILWKPATEHMALRETSQRGAQPLGWMKRLHHSWCNGKDCLWI